MKIKRYPPTRDKSLKAWNAADELILRYIQEEDLTAHSPILINDRFGYLTCHLFEHQPQVVVNYRSQEKAIEVNLKNNLLSSVDFAAPLLSNVASTELGIIKIPKSMDLFRLCLHQLHKKLEDNGVVICGFMTKYFTPQLIKISGEYFENVEQTKAWKKARLMVLSRKKSLPELNILNSFEWNGQLYQQYLGVFSAGHIDYATQFFLENLEVKSEDQNILDLASGNGVIGKYVREQNSDAAIYLTDDSWLAIESSKLNLTDGNNLFHYNNTLEDMKDDSFDLVLSNPPFHFDFEPNIEVTKTLFAEVKSKLKIGGRFEMVANRHLPYKPFLDSLFSKVEIAKQNKNFIVYSSVK